MVAVLLANVMHKDADLRTRAHQAGEQDASCTLA
jgi:hypothetical protein